MSVGAAGRARAMGVAALALAISAAPAAAATDPFAAELAAATAALDARQGKPEAIAPVAKLAWLEENLPPGATEAALRRAAGEGSHPLVAAQAALLLAHRLEERGDDAGGRALREPLHLLSKFWVVGPFGDGRGGHSEVFPPETDADAPAAGRTYKGKLGPVAWRRAENGVRDGALLVDALVRPDAQATAYVAAFVNSPRDQVVAIRLGSPGPTKVWIGGALVYTRDAVRTPAFDQDAAPARLRKGWNRVLVKTTNTDGAWWLHVRFTDAAGHALDLGDGALPDGAQVAPPIDAAKAKAKTPVVTTLEALLLARAQAARGDDAAEAWLDLGRSRAFAGAGDRDAREAAAAVESSIAARPSVAAYRLLAAVARDDDERRRAFEDALALSPAGDEARLGERALLLARLGEVARSQHRDAVALTRWREALAEDPGCWPASLALAEEEQAAGMPLVAAARVEALPASVRAVPRVVRALAGLLDVAGR
ncbi:MAG TPA: hypothetical protein VHJ20_20440, partial [Polyangia bacterium]|nr:hypothetical protein [Polyangia bacterium]